MPFVKGDTSKVSKPDKKGRVVVRILLQDPTKTSGIFPMPGNMKEDLVVEGSTVGEVLAAVNLALFGE